METTDEQGCGADRGMGAAVRHSAADWRARLQLGTDGQSGSSDGARPTARLRSPSLIRTFLWHGLGTLVILAYAVCAVFSAIPAHSAELHCVSASWYGSESGNRTATGEFFDGRSLTAAMPSRKHLGERYRVHYGSKSVVVRINDVGPAAFTHRGIDLSRAAAVRIGLIGRGVGTVCLERVK